MLIHQLGYLTKDVIYRIQDLNRMYQKQNMSYQELITHSQNILDHYDNNIKDLGVKIDYMLVKNLNGCYFCFSNGIERKNTLPNNIMDNDEDYIIWFVNFINIIPNERSH